MEKKNSTQRTLIALAIPILIEQILRNFLGTVNVFMLGSYSDDAVAAVGVANQVIQIVITAFNMIASGAAVLINQSLGAKKHDKAGAISMNSIGIALGLGGLLSVFFVFASRTIFQIMGLEDGLIGEATIYLQWVGAASVMIAISSVLAIIFRCYGNARIPMFVVFAMNICNVIGNYLVIFQPFEFPLHGAEGIGIIRFASESIGVLLMIIFLLSFKIKFQFSKIFRIRPRTAGQITSLGFMTGAEGISYTLSQVVTTSFLTAFGAAALSAKVYVNTVDSYACAIGVAIGQAAMIMAGQMMGAGKLDEAYHFVRKTWVAVTTSNVFFATMVFFFYEPIMHIFTQDPNIVSLTPPLFGLCILVNVGRSLNHSFNYGLRAAGYVFIPMIIASASIWLISCGVGYLGCTVAGLGVVGIYLGMGLDDFTRGFVAMIIWHTKKWTKAVAKIQYKNAIKAESSEQQA